MAHVDNTRNASSSRDEPVGRVNTDRNSTESSARPADTLALKVLIGIVVRSAGWWFRSRSGNRSTCWPSGICTRCGKRNCPSVRGQRKACIHIANHACWTSPLDWRIRGLGPHYTAAGATFQDWP
jgi:hypothetical protein